MAVADGTPETGKQCITMSPSSLRNEGVLRIIVMKINQEREAQPDCMTEEMKK
jgi:hypothetical protein